MASVTSFFRELVAKEDVVNKWSKTTVARRLEKQTNFFRLIFAMFI